MGAGLRVNCKYPIDRDDLGRSLAQALRLVTGNDSMLLAAQHIGKLMRSERLSPTQKAAGVLLCGCDSCSLVGFLVQ